MVSEKKIFGKWEYLILTFKKKSCILLSRSIEQNQQKVNTCLNGKIKICDRNLKILTLVCSKKVRVTMLVVSFSKVIKCSWSWPDLVTYSDFFFPKYMYQWYTFIWMSEYSFSLAWEMPISLPVRYGTQFPCFVQNRQWTRLSRCHPVTIMAFSIGAPCLLKK